MPGSLSAAGQRREVSLEPASVFDEGSAVLTPSDFAVLFVTAQTGSRPAGVRLLLRPAPLTRISTPGPTATRDLIDGHRSCPKESGRIPRRLAGDAPHLRRSAETNLRITSAARAVGGQVRVRRECAPRALAARLQRREYGY